MLLISLTSKQSQMCHPSCQNLQVFSFLNNLPGKPCFSIKKKPKPIKQNKTPKMINIICKTRLILVAIQLVYGQSAFSHFKLCYHWLSSTNSILANSVPWQITWDWVWKRCMKLQGHNSYYAILWTPVLTAPSVCFSQLLQPVTKEILIFCLLAFLFFFPPPSIPLVLK